MIGPDGDEYDVDLGDGHLGRFIGWHPDRSIASNEERYRGIDDIERVCLFIYHPAPGKTESGHCAGVVTFDTPEIARVFVDPHPRWKVESWEPLTISPSVLCRTCGDHGFIRGGKWVRA